MTRIIFTKSILLLLLLAAAQSVAAQQTSTSSPNVPQRVVEKSPSELQATATYRVEPVYPIVARWAGVSEPVSVKVLINHSGEVIDAQAFDGHPLLFNAAAMAA